MWFLSMPSLVISCVLAVFYLISLVLHVASLKHKENDVEITIVIPKNEIYQQQSVSLTSHNTFDTLNDNYNSKFQKFFSFDFVDDFAIFGSQLTPLRASPFSTLNFSTTFVINSISWWKHHPRPPPIG